MNTPVPRPFISYARHDATVAQRLYHDLKKAGTSPWLDSECLLPGQQWKAEIRRAIRDCTCFIAILSKHAVSKRGFVQSELKQALEILEEFPEDQIFVIPARIDECSPSHERLRDLHWVDLFPSYEDGLSRILSAVLGTDEPKEHAAAVLDVFRTRWTGGGAFAETPDGNFRLATILTNPTPREIATFYGTGCAIAFDAEVARGLPWASIEEIVVVVNSYRPLPEYRPAYPLPFQAAHVYYVEMDDPERTGSSRFVAQYSFQVDQQQRLGVVRLESGKPEPFVVRVNARTPGIYDFDVCLLASHKDAKQEIRIVENAEFLFEGR